MEIWGFSPSKLFFVKKPNEGKLKRPLQITAVWDDPPSFSNGNLLQGLWEMYTFQEQKIKTERRNFYVGYKELNSNSQGFSLGRHSGFTCPSAFAIS